MMAQRKPWWDTRLARCYGCGDGIMARAWLRHFFPQPRTIPANDRDHLRW